MQREREDMVEVLPKKRILMLHEESQGNRKTAVYTTTLNHNIQSMAQGMAQALHTSEHLRRVMDSDGCSPNWWVQFYLLSYARTRSTLHKLRWCFLKKRIIGVREESWVRKWDFENFQVEEKIKFINKICKRFGRFFYEEENFNF